MKIILCALLFSSITFQMMRIDAQGSSISFVPNSPLCVGEEVTMICYVQAPTAEDFGLNIASISINGSIPALHSLINGNTISGINASRYTADTVGLTVTQSRPGARLVISDYLPSDSDTTFQCAGQYPNGTEYIPIAPMRPMSQAAPPSTPDVTVSPTNCTHRVISWVSGGDRVTYYLYRDGTLLADDTTDTSYTDTDQLMVDTDYTYSVIASSCGVNTSEGTVNYNITGYRIDTGVSLSISYSKTTNTVGVNWTLNHNPVTPPLLLNYSLNLMVNHTQANITYRYDVNNSSLSQLSAFTISSQVIAGHNFTTNASVATNITACIRITGQCLSSFTGETVCGFFSSETVETPPPPPPPPSTNGSTIASSSVPGTMPPVPNITAAVIGAVVVVVIIFCGCSALIAVIILVIVCLKKKGQGSSKRSNLENEGGETKGSGGTNRQNIEMKKEYPPKRQELLYADLDLVASRTGEVSQTVEETHYTAVRPLMDGPRK